MKNRENVSESKEIAVRVLDITKIVTIFVHPLCSPDQEVKVAQGIHFLIDIQN